MPELFSASLIFSTSPLKVLATDNQQLMSHPWRVSWWLTVRIVGYFAQLGSVF